MNRILSGSKPNSSMDIFDDESSKDHVKKKSVEKKDAMIQYEWK
jgi:hypothetical protein